MNFIFFIQNINIFVPVKSQANRLANRRRLFTTNNNYRKLSYPICEVLLELGMGFGFYGVSVQCTSPSRENIYTGKKHSVALFAGLTLNKCWHCLRLTSNDYTIRGVPQSIPPENKVTVKQYSVSGEEGRIHEYRQHSVKNDVYIFTQTFLFLFFVFSYNFYKENSKNPISEGLRGVLSFF